MQDGGLHVRALLDATCEQQTRRRRRGSGEEETTGNTVGRTVRIWDRVMLWEIML